MANANAHIPSPYPAPRWLPGGHLQTIIPSQLTPAPAVTYRRERWSTPDNDFIDVDFLNAPTPTSTTTASASTPTPFLVLFHGLEGSSQSHYARALMAHLKSLGWSGAVPHFRSCSGEINLAPRFYHSGDATEIEWILRRLKLHADARGHSHFYVVGASLGGNALLRWLGESGHHADFVNAACAISAPLCLRSGGTSIARGFNRLYTHVFLRSLKPKSLAKLQQFPGLFDADALRRARNLYEFDNIVTAPLHGFRDTDDYWHRCSAKHILHDITVPTLILNAQNDPFLPPGDLPRTAAPCVTLDYPAQGGHLGFATGLPPGNLTWLPQKITSYLAEHP